MPAARADGPPAADLRDCGNRLGEVVLLQRRLLRYAVFPHVVGDFVSAEDCGALRLRIEFAGSTGREDRCPHDMRVKQFPISRQKPTRPPNSPFANCIGGSFKRRRRSIESKSSLKNRRLADAGRYMR